MESTLFNYPPEDDTSINDNAKRLSAYMNIKDVSNDGVMLRRNEFGSNTKEDINQWYVDMNIPMIYDTKVMTCIFYFTTTELATVFKLTFGGHYFKRNSDEII